MDLIPLGVRIALRNAVGGWGPFTVREIVDLFNSHGFVERDEATPDAGGERRTMAEQFLARIDWSSRNQARRFLTLVSDVLDFYPEATSEPDSPGRVLRKALAHADLVGTDGRLRLPTDQAETPNLDTTGIWVPEQPRVFFSHVHAARAEVTDVATQLEGLLCSCFVAHVQIEPARHWQDAIETALRTCDVLVAYVTQDFLTSRWTDQEVGWALGRGVPVVPVNAGLQPYGFFGSYQSVVADPPRPVRVALNILHAIAVACFRGERPPGRAAAPTVARFIVQAFCESPSYESTRQRFPLLGLIPSALWTSEMLDQLEVAVDDNRQIHEGVLRGRPGQPAPQAVAGLVEGIRRQRN